MLIKVKSIKEYFWEKLFFLLNFRAPNSVPAGRKPVLTLFTHDQCSLCDELVQELEPFKERFELEKVDIKKKENLRFLRLYRLDIPVLHLNGQFLCMHRLNRGLLEKRLAEIEEMNSQIV